MSDYVKLTDYAAKDALLSGNPAKIIKGVDIGADFDAVAVAVATKWDALVVNSATSKTTPVDADLLPIVDSAASNVLKKLTWANLKATLLTWLQGTVFPSPGAIGGTTPSTGAFTTLTATDRISATSNQTTPSDGSAYFYKSATGAVMSGFQAVMEVGSAGSRSTVGTFSSTGLAVTGVLSATGIISTSNNGMVVASSTNTSAQYYKATNASGDLYIATDNSGGSGFAAGGVAYAANYYLSYSAPHIWSIAAAEKMRLDASGNLLVGTASPAANTSHNFVNSVSGTWAVRVANSHASNPFGETIVFSGAAPNGVGNQFLTCQDTGATRVELRSNGGLANYSANNVNLSDARVKKDFAPAKSYYDQWRDIEFVTFLYKDQTDTELNLGVKAQQLESVFPELIDNSGFGEAPEGEAPYKAVYQTDFQYATAKALQEAIAKIEALTARLAALEAA